MVVSQELLCLCVCMCVCTKNEEKLLPFILHVGLLGSIELATV